MTNIEILHKNEKLTKRLLELKADKCRLGLIDKLRLKLLHSYNIPLSEIEIIDGILRKEDHIRYKNINTWQDDSGNVLPNNSDPYVTDIGLIALKKNYYEVSFFIKKVTSIESIFRLLLIIITIITTFIGIKSSCSNGKLKSELKLKTDENILLKKEISKIKAELIEHDKHKTINMDTLNKTY